MSSQVAMFYGLGSVVQHYWCNIYTQRSLADELSSNHIAIAAGIVLWILGESINFYHHAILANLRLSGTSSGYVIPSGGLFKFVVCPHYLGWVLCCGTQGLKNVQFSHPGQVHFPAELVIFDFHNGQGPGQVVNWLNIRSKLRLAQGKQNLRAACPKGKLEVFFVSPMYIKRLSRIYFLFITFIAIYSINIYIVGQGHVVLIFWKSLQSWLQLTLPNSHLSKAPYVQWQEFIVLTVCQSLVFTAKSQILSGC